jgi:hypothetical protein
MPRMMERSFLVSSMFDFIPGPRNCASAGSDTNRSIAATIAFDGIDIALLHRLRRSRSVEPAAAARSRSTKNPKARSWTCAKVAGLVI